MKRNWIFFLAASAVCALALTGCGAQQPAQDDTSSAQVESVVSQSSSPADLNPENAAVGTWILAENTINGEKIDISEMQSVYVFANDGTFETLLNGDSLGTGTYTLEGDTIETDLSGSKTTMKLGGDQITLESDTSDGPAVMVYQRAQN